MSLPSIMDLATFGCRAVVLKPPPSIKKGDLSTRGWVGQFLGRTLGGCRDQWDVLSEGKIVSSSSVQIDEENLPWHRQASHQPLRPTSRPKEVPNNDDSRGSPSPSIFSLSNRESLCALNLFCGPYTRAEGLSGRLRDFGWSNIYDVDNNPTSGGGWEHDLLNDAFFAKLLSLATRGAFDAMMIAFPCSTFSAARLFDTDPPGPPAVRDKDNPDGFSGDNLDPKHAAELNRTKMLLDRSFQLAIAANKSPKKTTIILENPADKSVPNTLPYGEDTKNHGSIWATSHFKDLKFSVPNRSMVTFSFCRFGSDYQKYTTLWYTNEAGPVLDQLSSPAYQCNHAKHPKIAGGRLPNGTWASAAAAAYPAQLNVRLAMALTHARTGDPRPVP